MDRILKKKLDEAQMLADRLERLSADSVWAHQASGVRGGLLEVLTVFQQKGQKPGTKNELDEPLLARLDVLLREGFMILENAAKEIPEEPTEAGKG